MPRRPGRRTAAGGSRLVSLCGEAGLRGGGPTRGSRSVSLPPSESAPGPRVVHLGKYYPPSPGGIETHTQTLARTQAELGADVRVVVVNHAAPDGRDATFDRFTRTPYSEARDGPVRV